MWVGLYISRIHMCTPISKFLGALAPLAKHSILLAISEPFFNECTTVQALGANAAMMGWATILVDSRASFSI